MKQSNSRSQSTLYQINQFVSKYALVISLLFALLIFAFVLLFLQITYQTNDDAGMMLMIRGISIVDKPSANVIFMNIIYASFIKALYDWIDGIDWYPLIFLIILFTSYSYLSHLIFKYASSIYLKVAYIAFFTPLFVVFIVSLQFTIVAGTAGVAGVVGLLLSSKKNTAEKVIACILLIISSLIRIDSFRLAVLMFLPAYVYKVYVYWYGESVKKAALFSFTHLKKNDWIIYLATVIFLSFILQFYSANAYGDYYQFNKKRNIIYDFSALEKIDPQLKEQILRSVGWSSNDYNMFRSWFFFNEKLYNIEKFDQMAKYVPRKKVYEVIDFMLSDEVIQFLRQMAKEPLILCFFFLYIGILLHSFSLKNFIALLGSFAYLIIVYLMVSLFLRQPPFRTFIIMYLATCMFPFVVIGQNNALRNTANMISSITSAIGIFIIVYASLLSYKLAKGFYQQKILNGKSLQASIDDLLQKYPNMKLLVSWGAAFPYEAIKPFEDISYMKKIKILGLGTGQQSKEVKELLKSIGIFDLYLAIAERKDVYLLVFFGWELQLYKNYMWEHYQKTVEMKFLPNPLEKIKNSKLVKVSLVQ
ncbi:MAG: hypothetical protein NZM39_04495 [Bernardetiaceae bacterium]|nr:hypothetical protein [Bernardetiaceae bacterium]